MKAFSLIAVFLALFSGGNNIFTPAHMPLAKNGVMDLTNWSYNDNGFVYLNGEWEFYWNRLLAPDEVLNTEQIKYRNILDNWKDNGFATYKLKIAIKDSGRYAIYIPMVLVTHKLWIDDNLIGAYGIVGTSRAAENPKIQNYIEEMYLTGGTHSITIQASNYHLQTGGVRLPISFGKYKEIQDYRELKLFVEALVLGLIGFMIVSHLISFLVARRNYANLYFILFCICNFFFFFFRSERFLLKFFLDLNWELLSKIGFSAIFSIIPALLLFNHALYPLEVIEKKLKPVKIIWGVLIAYILFLPSYSYTHIVPVFKIFSLILFVLIFIQAKTVYKKRVKGTLIALSGVIIFAIGMANEIFYDHRISQLSIFVPCNLYLLFTQSFLTSLKSFEAFRSLKKSREEISNQNIELNRLNNLKDEFLSNTTHELKTPLHGIMGIAETLKDGIAGELSQKAKSDLSIIINSAQRLSFLVNDILDAQRLRNQDVKLNLASFDLNEIVSVVLSVSQPLLKNKPVEFKNSITPDTFYIHADSNRIYQIIQNLVSNACKFTESGFIEISAQKKTDMIYVAVSDTGIGISAKDQKRIFERFEQVEHMSIGSGLGLSISKSIVELHGGSVFLESVLGQGSTFAFTIPSGSKTNQCEEILLPKLLNYTNEIQIVSEITPELQGTQILVVDDEPVNLKVVSDYLTMDKYKVHQCRSGKEAINYLKENTPGLILLDVMMPEMDGFSVCKKIREKYSHFELPVIFLTAKNQVTDLVQGFSLGGNDYLTKPFSKNELLARVRCQLSVSRAKERLTNLRDFANKITLFKNIDKLIKEMFNYIEEDLSVDGAALFYDNKFVSCTHDDKQAFIDVYTVWNGVDHHLILRDDSFVLLKFEEVKNNVIVIKIKSISTPVDIEYFRTLKIQAGLIVRNFQNLINDKPFLDDLHTIMNLKKHIRFIKRENKQTILYEDKDEQVVYLTSSLKTIECFFSNDLIRLNRFCLANPKKIMWVEMYHDEKSKIDRYVVNVDGEEIISSENFIHDLPRKQKIKFLNN